MADAIARRCRARAGSLPGMGALARAKPGQRTRVATRAAVQRPVQHAAARAGALCAEPQDAPAQGACRAGRHGGWPARRVGRVAHGSLVQLDSRIPHRHGRAPRNPAGRRQRRADEHRQRHGRGFRCHSQAPYPPVRRNPGAHGRRPRPSGDGPALPGLDRLGRDPHAGRPLHRPADR
ncbi:hypothetical protein G6F22_014493 [Rhizopus arrhizus]|nr:hypothetical protein G6F22_014493 [Rhizopus arrhizus]